MTSYAYTVGCWAACARLGLSKLAAIGARTMLPPALVEGAVAGVTKAERHLSPEILKALPSHKPMLPPAMRGAEGTAAVPTGVLKESPWHQYMAVTEGKAGITRTAPESSTSRWFRDQLAGAQPAFALTVRPPRRKL